MGIYVTITTAVTHLSSHKLQIQTERYNFEYKQNTIEALFAKMDLMEHWNAISSTSNSWYRDLNPHQVTDVAVIGTS